jgi:hypothetical protein
VIQGEDPAEFDALRAELEAQYAPQTAMEYELVERLAILSWRLRRISRFEADTIEARRIQVAKPDSAEKASRDKLIAEIKSMERQFPPPEGCKKTSEQMMEEDIALSRQRAEEYIKGANLGLALIRDSEDHDVLGKISRYEAGLMSSVNRTMALLHALQAQRKAEEAERRTIDCNPTKTYEMPHQELTGPQNGKPNQMMPQV